jgi:hypothetical protein
MHQGIGISITQGEGGSDRTVISRGRGAKNISVSQGPRRCNSIVKRCARYVRGSSRQPLRRAFLPFNGVCFASEFRADSLHSGCFLTGLQAGRAWGGRARTHSANPRAPQRGDGRRSPEAPPPDRLSARRYWRLT